VEDHARFLTMTRIRATASDSSTMRTIASIALGVVASFLTVTSAPVLGAPAGTDVGSWEAFWTSVLTRYVDDAGRIDFAGLQKDHRDLDTVVGFVGAVDPASQPQAFPDRHSRIAFYINAYNALAMYGVVHAGVPKSLGGFRKFSFFYLQKFLVGGKEISLYRLENDVIRPLGEERIHFALNCMVNGCPKLPRSAFVADALERQLDRAARTFMREDRNVRVNPLRGEVWLSAIFDFYTQDFLAHAPSLITYVNRYRAEPIPSDFKVRFIDYDWTVNDRRHSDAR
jgi:hypothetical protein